MRAASRCSRHFSPIALVRDQDRAEICVVRSRLGSELATATAAAGATLLRGLMEEDDAPPGPRRRTLAAGETLTLTLTAKAGDLRRLTARGRPIAVDPWPSCRADRRLRRGHQRFRLGQARRWPRRPAPGR